MPYQVAFEFLENSKGVPVGLNHVLSETLKKIDTISRGSHQAVGAAEE